MPGSVTIERRESVSIWTLDNPRKNNALDAAMLTSLGAAADAVERDRETKAVIIAGRGTKAFCAGADIADWGGLDSVDFVRNWIGAGHLLFDRLARLPVPVIGALHGWVFGGGLEIAALCDVRVAAPDAVFALPEASLGVTPGWSGAQRLARLMPQALLREMCLTGGRLSAERLLSVGFLNELADDPLTRSLEIATRIAKLAPRAVEATKLVLGAAAGESREQALDRLAAGLVSATLDKAEGLQSFKEKRPPNFRGA